MAIKTRLAIASVAALALSACVNGTQGISESPELSRNDNETVSSNPDSGRLAQGPDSQFAANLDAGEDTQEAAPNNPRISDEQEFDAVASRETIESDAERLKRLRGKYKLVESENVPERPDGVNIAEYALSTENAPGERLYRRINFGTPKRISDRCASYATDDDAQFIFLSKGGPEDDPLRLDPDGDGFACNWSPIPYRRLFQ